MNFIKKLLAAVTVLGLCALSAMADSPTASVGPRNTVLFNGWFISNAVPAITNINAQASVVETAPFQHGMSVTTILTGTNQIVPTALNITNYFDLGKITNSGGVYGTNWTTDQPIQSVGTGTGVTNSVQARWIPGTNFDGYELIRLTKTGANSTNNYSMQIILGQTP